MLFKFDTPLNSYFVVAIGSYAKRAPNLDYLDFIKSPWPCCYMFNTSYFFNLCLCAEQC